MSSHVDLLSLSDAELEAVMAAAGPLDRQRRDLFLQEVAAELRRFLKPAPGLVGRVCREIQRRHFDPPMLNEARSPNPAGRKLGRIAS